MAKTGEARWRWGGMAALVAAAGVTLVCRPPVARAQAEKNPVRERYTKREVMIPMRDGVKLFTTVYAPRDSSRPVPILLTRTPYSVRPYGPDRFPNSVGPSRSFLDAGYIVAYQDVRGCFMSEGEWVQMRPMLRPGQGGIDEGTDAWDTIDWLVNNVPGNNGRVGMWGISYPGFYTAAALVRPHPALRAASPQAPIADWFVGDDFHHNGAFYLLDAFPFLSFFGRARPRPTSDFPTAVEFEAPDAYRFYLSMGALPNADAKYLKGSVPFWNDLMEHGTYDAYWQSRNLLPHLQPLGDRPHPAVLTVGGWFDAEDLYGPLGIHRRLEGSGGAPDDFLVMGPWSHGGWAGSEGSSLGDLPFGSKTGEYFREQVQFPFFQHYLRDDGAFPIKKALTFDTGAHEWKGWTAWPPRNLRPQEIYLASGGRLTGATDPRSPSFDEYVSDPAHPVSYTSVSARGRGVTYMVEDQRFAARRPDVLVYEGDPLAEDLSLTGPVEVDLWVSSSGTDSDWVVKLIDEYPLGAKDAAGVEIPSPLRGYEMLVRGDVMRAKFRNSFEKPEPLKPGRPTELRFRMRDICHTFRKGHRLMVQVQSSWFPLVDRNPQRFVDIYHARDEDFRKATERVYHSRRFPSRITVGSPVGSRD